MKSTAVIAVIVGGSGRYMAAARPPVAAILRGGNQAPPRTWGWCARARFALEIAFHAIRRRMA